MPLPDKTGAYRDLTFFAFCIVCRNRVAENTSSGICRLIRTQLRLTHAHVQSDKNNMFAIATTGRVGDFYK